MNEVQQIIVVPACNEEATIADCILHLKRAILKAHGNLKRVGVIIVCDSCSDRTFELARIALMDIPSVVINVSFKNVGQSRDEGVRRGLLEFPSARWLSFTDADSFVEPSWLDRQIEIARMGFDVYMGRIHFERTSDILNAFAHSYETQSDKRIHGANMGLSVFAYILAGGFPHLRAHEDRELVLRLEQSACKLYWDEHGLVRTSTRDIGRTVEGFANTLRLFSARFHGTAEVHVS